MGKKGGKGCVSGCNCSFAALAGAGNMANMALCATLLKPFPGSNALKQMQQVISRGGGRLTYIAAKSSI